MDRRKADRHLTSVELIQVVLKNVKKQEANMREEEVAAKSRNIQVTILHWQCTGTEFASKPWEGQSLLFASMTPPR